MEAINTQKEKLFLDPTSPFIGNAKGNVIIVEFMDYQCGYCKEMSHILENLIHQHSDYKIVIKEFPIFGKNSEYAALAAIASQKQGQTKFAAFHSALFETESLTQHNIQRIAEEVCQIDLIQLNKDMVDPLIKKELEDNLILGKTLKLEGTPAFVLGDRNLSQPLLINGIISENDFQRYINQLQT